MGDPVEDSETGRPPVGVEAEASVGVQVGAASATSADNFNDNKTRNDNNEISGSNGTKERTQTEHHKRKRKKKKNQHGRQARKRKKKVRAIEEAATKAFESSMMIRPTASSTTTTTTSTTAVLPTDRSYTLDAVKQLSSLSMEDKQQLVGQLGFLPGNALQVVARVQDLFRLATTTTTPMTMMNSSSSSNGILDIPEPPHINNRNNKKTQKQNNEQRRNDKETNQLNNNNNNNDDDDDDNEGDAQQQEQDHNRRSPEALKRRFESLQRRMMMMTTIDVNDSSSPTNNNASSTYFDQLMNQPLVLKSYPLAIREESDGKRSRRKRRKGSTVDVTPKKTEAETATAAETAATDSTETSLSPDLQQEAAPPGPTKETLLMEPFPTIYWVTHPYAKSLISQLELDRFGSTYEYELKKKKPPIPETTTTTATGKTHATMAANTMAPPPSLPTARSMMKRAHESYAQERYDLITDDDWAWIRSRGTGRKNNSGGGSNHGDSGGGDDPESSSTKLNSWEAAFALSRGVAGIRDPTSVKCLHAHAAHYWSGCHDNIVGRWVSTRVADLWLSNLTQRLGDDDDGN